MHAQLVHQAGPVLLHGLGAHAKDIRDLGRGVALGDEAEDLLFSFREEFIAADGHGRWLRL